MCIRDSISRVPCCESARFPFPRKVFNICIVRAIEVLYRTPAELFMPGVAGPKFAKPKGNRPPKIKALVVEYDSILAHTTSYEDMDSFFRQVCQFYSKSIYLLIRLKYVILLNKHNY